MNATNAAPCGALWDMDGTLIDSTELHWITWRDALADAGREISYAEFQAVYGKRNDRFLRQLLGEDTTDEKIAQISDAKEERYRAMVHADGLALLPGVQYWLDYLRDHGWQQAIVTSAPRLNLETIIDALGIRTCFGALVSGDDVEHGKPDPQPFLRAAAQLGVPPARCIVIEDSAAGIESGKSGGMRTIGVLNSQDSLDADITVADLTALESGTFERLLEQGG